MREDYIVTCGHCGSESVEHLIQECEVCKKDVCLICTGFVWDNPDCSCSKHPANIHFGKCWAAVNGMPNSFIIPLQKSA